MRGEAVDPLLGEVAHRRLPPTRRMQALQKAFQDRVIAPTLAGEGRGTMRAPWPVRLLDAVPVLRRLPARVMGLGFGRERLDVPEGGAA